MKLKYYILCPKDTYFYVDLSIQGQIIAEQIILY